MKTVMHVVLPFFSSYPAMGMALYRWGVMAQQDSTGDLSMGGRRLRRVVAGREFQS